MNGERNSEMRMTWAVIALVGAQLLGVDVGQIISMITQAQQHLEGAGATGLLSGDLSLPALAGVYVWQRSKLKVERLKSDSVQSVISSATEVVKNVGT